MFYGLTDRLQILQMATAICDVLGHGSAHCAVDLMVETCAAETHLGTARDKTIYGAGTGVAQVDKGTFEWLQGKYGNHPIADKLAEHFNIHLGRIVYQELEISPLVCLIFCRLRYWTVSKPIPRTQPERASYWKVFYNSSAGKGTPEEYLERCKACQVDLVMGQASHA